MKHISMNFYADPGHGWAKVKRSHPVFRRVADKITRSSYQRGEWVFLEEDYDLSIFIQALREAGYEVKFVEHYSRFTSRIRNYDNYYYISER